MFRNYQAGVRIVYNERAWSELAKRNRSHSALVREAVLERLARKLDVPGMTKAHRAEKSVS